MGEVSRQSRAMPDPATSERQWLSADQVFGSAEGKELTCGWLAGPGTPAGSLPNSGGVLLSLFGPNLKSRFSISLKNNKANFLFTPHLSVFSGLTTGSTIWWKRWVSFVGSPKSHMYLWLMRFHSSSLLSGIGVLSRGDGSPWPIYVFFCTSVTDSTHLPVNPQGQIVRSRVTG